MKEPLSSMMGLHSPATVICRLLRICPSSELGVTWAGQRGGSQRCEFGYVHLSVGRTRTPNAPLTPRTGLYIICFTKGVFPEPIGNNPQDPFHKRRFTAKGKGVTRTIAYEPSAMQTSETDRLEKRKTAEQSEGVHKKNGTSRYLWGCT